MTSKTLEVIVLSHPLFTPEGSETEDDFHNSEARLNAAGIEYPSFVTFDEPKKKIKIFFDGRQFSAAPEVDGNWDSLEELYDHIERELGEDADFDGSVSESEQVKNNIGGMLFLRSAPDAEGIRARSSRLIMSPIDHRNLAVAHYVQWLCEAREWLQNPDDFLSAYSFLAGHPAFWKRHRETHPNDWDTESGVSTIWSSPHRREDGSIVMMMETGSMVRPAFLHRYHDLRLDTYEATYELGIIATAKKVHKFFGLDGEERPDVDYEKSSLEKELEARLAEFDNED